MEDAKIKVSVDVQEAEAGLDKVIDKSKEAKKELKDLNDKSKEGIPAIKDLGQSFETALGKAEGNLKGLVSSTNGFIKGLKNTVPAFKAARAAGDSLWKSIKIGIASTGIGLLVVAIGELIGNWDKWTSTIQGWLPWVKKSQEETDKFTKANENLITANTEQNKLIDHQARLMRAAGAEEKEIIKYKIQETNAIIANTQAQIEETKAKIANIRAHSAFERWVNGENKSLEKLEESLKSLEAENKKYQDSLQSLNWSLEEEEVKSQHSRTESVKKGSQDRTKAVKEEFQKELEYLKQFQQDALKAMVSVSQNKDNLFSKKSQDWFSNLLLPENPRADSDTVIEYLEEAFREANPKIYNKLVAHVEDLRKQLQKAVRGKNKDLAESLKQEIEKEVKEINSGNWKLTITPEIFNGLLEGDAQEYAKELNLLVAERHRILAGGHATLSEDLETELKIQERAWEQQKDLLEKRKRFFKEDSVEYGDIVNQIKVLNTESEAEIMDLKRNIAEAVLEEKQATLDLEEANSQSDMKFFNLEDFNRIYDERLKALQTYYKSMMDSYDAGSAEYEKYKKLYEDITNQLNGIDKNRTQAMYQELNAQYKKWYDVYSKISSVFESISDMYEEDSRAIKENAEAKRKANKISEEEYQKELARSKRQFKRAQKLQIATAVVNTIAGAIGAFLQASAAYPPPYGQILGAASATAVTAAGVAEIQKLKNKNFDSDSVDGGGVGASAPNVGVTPIDVRDDIQQSPSVLADSQSPRDQRVWILQGDLEDSHRQVEIRESNSTF